MADYTSRGRMTGAARDMILAALIRARTGGGTINGTVGVLVGVSGAVVYTPAPSVGVIDGTVSVLVGVSGEMVYTPGPRLHTIDGTVSVLVGVSGEMVYTPTI